MKTLCVYFKNLFAVFLGIIALAQTCIAQDTTFNSIGGFTKNMGQLLDTDDEVTDAPLYYAPSGSLANFLMEDKIVYALTSCFNRADIDTIYRMDLLFYNANESSEFEEGDVQYHKNYYLSHTG